MWRKINEKLEEKISIFVKTKTKNQQRNKRETKMKKLNKNNGKKILNRKTKLFLHDKQNEKSSQSYFVDFAVSRRFET